MSAIRISGLLLLTILISCGDSYSGSDTDVVGENKMTIEKPETNTENFLSENAKRSEVNVTESGLQYEIVVSGSGKTPNATSTVLTHYSGRFIDGTEFDGTTGKGPISFPVNGVIKGWTEALLLMQEGDKWRLYIPPELAYGQRGIGPIPPNSTLIFDIELIKVK